MQSVESPASVEKQALPGHDRCLYTICGGALATNSYVLVREGRVGLVIDAGVALAQVWDSLYLEGVEIKQVLLTHGHYDHIDGLSTVLERTNARAYAHPLDLEMISQANIYGFAWRWPRISVPEVAALPAGTMATCAGDVTIRHTPGHTPGGTCFEIAELLFTGDTLFRRRAGRTDLPGGDAAQLRRTMDRLNKTVPPSTLCLPGHGPAFQMRDAELRA